MTNVIGLSWSCVRRRSIDRHKSSNIIASCAIRKRAFGKLTSIPLAVRTRIRGNNHKQQENEHPKNLS